jgi:hypothetical protein
MTSRQPGTAPPGTAGTPDNGPMLPASGPGAGSAQLRLVAAGALIAAAGLVLPQVARHD